MTDTPLNDFFESAGTPLAILDPGGAFLHLNGAWREVLARVPVDSATLDNLQRLDQLIYQPPRGDDEGELVEAARRWLHLAVKPSAWKPPAASPERADA